MRWFTACAITQQGTLHIAFTATTHICLLFSKSTINQGCGWASGSGAQVNSCCPVSPEKFSVLIKSFSMCLHMCMRCAFYRCWRLKHFGWREDPIEHRRVMMAPLYKFQNVWQKDDDLHNLPYNNGGKMFKTQYFAHNESAWWALWHMNFLALWIYNWGPKLKGALLTRVKVVDLKSSELCVTAGSWVLEFLGVFEPAVRQAGRQWWENIPGTGKRRRVKFEALSFK